MADILEVVDDHEVALSFEPVKLRTRNGVVQEPRVVWRHVAVDVPLPNVNGHVNCPEVESPVSGEELEVLCCCPAGGARRSFRIKHEHGPDFGTIEDRYV